MRLSKWQIVGLFLLVGTALVVILTDSKIGIWGSQWQISFPYHSSDIPQTRKIFIKQGSKSLYLIKQDNLGWQVIEQDTFIPADQAKIERFLTNLANEKIIGEITVAADQLHYYQQPPSERLHFILSTEQNEKVSSTEQSEQLNAELGKLKHSDWGQYFIVFPEQRLFHIKHVHKLSVASEDWEEKAIRLFDSTDVNRIAIYDDQDRAKITLLRHSPKEQWQVINPKGRTYPAPNRIEELIQRLSTLNYITRRSNIDVEAIKALTKVWRCTINLSSGLELRLMFGAAEKEVKDSYMYITKIVILPSERPKDSSASNMVLENMTISLLNHWVFETGPEYYRLLTMFR